MIYGTNGKQSKLFKILKIINIQKTYPKLAITFLAISKEKGRLNFLIKRFWNLLKWFKILMLILIFQSQRDGGLTLHQASDWVQGLDTYLNAQADVHRWTCRAPWLHTRGSRTHVVFPTAWCYSGVHLCHSSDCTITEKDHFVCLVT